MRLVNLDEVGIWRERKGEGGRERDREREEKGKRTELFPAFIVLEAH